MKPDHKKIAIDVLLSKIESAKAVRREAEQTRAHHQGLADGAAHDANVLDGQIKALEAAIRAVDSHAEPDGADAVQEPDTENKTKSPATKAK